MFRSYMDELSQAELSEVPRLQPDANLVTLWLREILLLVF